MALTSQANDAIVNGTNNPTAVQRSSAGQKAPGQTLMTFSGMQTFTATVTTIALYTPTTGKNFYLTDLNLTSDVASGVNTDIQLITGTTASVLFRTSVHSLAPVTVTGIESQPVAAGAVPMNMVIASAATVSHLWWNIAGWEE